MVDYVYHAMQKVENVSRYMMYIYVEIKVNFKHGKNRPPFVKRLYLQSAWYDDNAYESTR